jgi:hypothetical protein
VVVPHELQDAAFVQGRAKGTKGIAVKNWNNIIVGLHQLIMRVGPLWPKSTTLAGYAEGGPYHCKNCEYLKGLKEGAPVTDAQGRGRCNQPVMMADPEVRKDKSGLAIVNIQIGCCEFVQPIKKG